MIFFDHSRFHPPESTRYREIPYHHFNVHRGKMGYLTKILLITGIVSGILAGFALCGTPVGTTGFYLIAGEEAVAVLTIIFSLTHYYACKHINDEELQKLPLPQAQSVDEYLELLDVDQENRYSLMIPDLLQHHLEVSTANLHSQSALDIGRENIYLFNGKPVPLGADFEEKVHNLTNNDELTEKIVRLAAREPDPIRFKKELKKIAGDHFTPICKVFFTSREIALQKLTPSTIFPYLNQALFADMTGPLRGRYVNEDLVIQLGQRAAVFSGENSSMLVDVILKDGKFYVRLAQIFQITFLNRESRPFFIKAELLIDTQKGSGTLSWTSPQTNQPTFV
jgi:hypothetical protein